MQFPTTFFFFLEAGHKPTINVKAKQRQHLIPGYVMERPFAVLHIPQTLLLSVSGLARLKMLFWGKERSKCIKWSNRQKLTDITYFSFYFHRPSLFQQPFWITCVIQGISAVISVAVVNLSLNEHITQYQTFFINTSRNAVCFPKVLKNLLQNIFLQV